MSSYETKKLLIEVLTEVADAIDRQDSFAINLRVKELAAEVESIEEGRRSITAERVREMQEATGLGMMQCKNALVACEGDFDKAVAYLRR